MTADLWNEIVELTVEHLVLVVASMAVAIAVALPAGILLTRRAPLQRWVLGFANVMRSEEHTSELQSQSNLVCRLLLEKKKNGRHRKQRPVRVDCSARLRSRRLECSRGARAAPL